MLVDSVQAALEELKITQDVITHQENFTFKVLSWAIGIVTALTIGFFHKNVNINGLVYMSIGFLSVFSFFWVAKGHWDTFYKAIERSAEIEIALKNGAYQGFSLNHALESKQGPVFRAYPRRFFLPYLMLVLIVIFSGMYKIYCQP